MTQTQTAHELERELTAYDSTPDVDVCQNIDRLNALAWELKDSDVQRAAQLSDTAYTLANDINIPTPYQRGIAYALCTQGYLNMRSGDYPLGMARLLNAQAIFETLQTVDGPSVDDGLIDVFDGMAGIHFQMGNLSEGLDYSHRMLEIAQRIGDQRRISNAYNNLGNIYFEMGDIVRARETFEQNMLRAAETDDRRIEALSYANLADLHFSLGQYPLALEHALHVLKLSREAGFAHFMIYALDYIGKIQLKLGNQAEAIAHLEHALSASRLIGSHVTEVLNLFTLGQAHYDIGQPDQALAYLQHSVTVAQSINAWSGLVQAHKLLAEVYEQQRNAAQALSHFKQYHAFKELVAGEKANQRFQVLQIVHDTKAAQREANILQIRADELQREINERVKVEAQLQRQLDSGRALLAFSQALLAPVEYGADQLRLLSEALQHLLIPSGASNVALSRNVVDPELGLCGQLIAGATAPDFVPFEPEHITVARYLRFLEQLRHRSTTAQDIASSVLLPWSVVPPTLLEQLAAGIPVGGPIQELYATVPAWRDHLHESHVFSVQFFPIHIGDTWWGCVTFVDMHAERVSSDDEIVLLGTAAEILISTLQRWQAEAKLRLLNEQLEQQVDTRTAELREAIALLQNEIHERERAEAAIQEMVVHLDQRLADRTRELATFFDLTLLAGQTVGLSDVLEAVLPRIIEVTRSQAICIDLLNDDHTHLQRIAQINLTPDLPPLAQTAGWPHAFQRWIAQPSDPLLTTALPMMTKLPTVVRLPGFQSYLGAQIRIGSTIKGVLSCYRVDDRGFSLDEVAMVTALAEQIGMMLATQHSRQNAQAIAVLEERQRLARDLHDSVTQSLYSLSLFARAGREAAETNHTERLKRNLVDLEHTTLHALREMRLLLYELRPADLQQEGLVRALQLRLEGVERRANLRLDVAIDVPPGLARSAEVELYHIIVEALNNVLKHADATDLTLHIGQTNQELHIHIVDNGQGFVPQAAQGGMGLRNIRERVARLDGQIEIVSAPGTGTRLDIMLPYRTEARV